MIEILVVDDRPLIGLGNKMIIENEGDMTVHLETSSLQAFNRIKKQSYDLMLFKFQLVETEGFKLTKKVLELNPTATILLYNCSEKHFQLDLFMESGVIGLISSTITRENFIRNIRSALNQEVVLPRFLLKEFYKRLSSQKELPTKETVTLNEKEKIILKEIKNGKTNKNIAEELYIGQRTLEYNISSIFNKLGVSTRMDAVLKAKEIGLLSS